MQAGDRLELTIESLAYRGAGIARHEGRVVFVHGVCEGEQVEAVVTRLRPRFAEAELVRVLAPAPERIAPVCRVTDAHGEQVRMPGCVYDHLRYDAELQAKQRQFADFLQRQGGIENAPDMLAAPQPSPDELHYRNKITLHAGYDRDLFGLGYVADDNRSIIDIEACPLAAPAINERLAALRENPRFQRAVREGDRLTLRWTPADGAVEWLGNPPRREPSLRMPSVVGELEVPLDAFYQVNGAVADLLIKRVTSEIMATTPKALIDLYCGVGGFALAAAQAGVARTLGVESGSQAVEAARRNAARIGTNSEFANLDAAEGLHAALGEVGAEGVCVVLDPPRKGLDSHVLDLLIEAQPSTIIYVSCAPDMLARDLVTLQQRGGYSFASGALLDMFPRTAHFETVTTLRSANH